MRPSSRFATALTLLVVLVSAAIFWRTLPSPFIRDDILHLENARRWERPPTHLLDHFSEDFWAGHPAAGLYRPFTAATIQATAWVSGLAPAPLRLGNILLLAFMALAAAFCALCSGISRTWSLLLALLIVAHPLFSEDVCEVVSRSELLAASFSLLAAALWMRETIGPAAAVGGGFCLLCALLSKEGAFGALPALGIVLLRRPEGPRRRWSDTASSLAVSGLLLILVPTFVVLLRARILGAAFALDPAGISPIDNALVTVGIGGRALTGIANLARYLGLLAWPAALSPDYSFAAILPLHSFASLPFWAGLLALLIGAIWCAYAWVRGWRAELFGLLLAFGSWLLISSIPQPIGTIFAERLFTLPACGLLLALVAAADRSLPKDSGRRARRTAVRIALVAALALAIRSFVRAGDWHDPLTLYTRALAVVPNSARVEATVGHYLRKSGDPTAAAAHVRRALAIVPDYRRAMTEEAALALQQSGPQHDPEALARAWVWSWLAVHAPGAGPDEDTNLRQLTDVARRRALPDGLVAQAANAIADEHRGVPLYEEMRMSVTPP